MGDESAAASKIVADLFKYSGNITDSNINNFSFSDLRVLFGDGENNPTEASFEDWQHAGVVAEFYVYHSEEVDAFGEYSWIEDGDYLDGIWEDLFATINVVSGDFGADGIEVSYQFSGLVEGFTPVAEEYWEEGYTGDYYSQYIDYDISTYLWFDGNDWVEGDASGVPLAQSVNGQMGTEGNDIIDGKGASQEISGLGGDDFIDARGGNDTVFGGEGNDSIYGNGGDDVLFGEGGDDTFLAGDGNDEFYGGDGFDFVSFENLNPQRGVKISLSNGSGEEIYGKSPKGYETTFESIESVKGSRGDDRIQGQDGVAQTLDGHDGDDRLFGGDQADTLIDGAGRDNMRGRGGADTFALVADGDRDTISDFEIGSDQIDITAWGVSDSADLSFVAQSNKTDRVTVSFEDETLLIKTQDLAADISVDDFIFRCCDAGYRLVF
jgi:Ca2+-binding RTX toxin-like protein